MDVVERLQDTNEFDVTNKLTDRLRGQYACGPHLPNGKPEFGWRQFQAPPIQHEAADVIDAMLAEITRLRQDLNTAIERAAQRASEHAVFIERDKNEIALNIASSIRSLKEESSND
jgi:flagellar hook-basal body complex protein FliE